LIKSPSNAFKPIRISTSLDKELIMMINRTAVCLFTAATITFAAGAEAQTASPPAGLDEAAVQSTRAMANELLTQLGQKLKASLSAEGPEAAVSVCKEASPAIAKALSAKHGAQMTRVGTRVRNPAMGTPNPWQKEALAQFEARLSQAESPATMEYWSVVDAGNGKRELHYAKAITVQAMCVTCHGTASDIPATLAEKIRTEYPQDQATGYSVGKLRGAAVISRPLP
jgi:4-hydroxy-3-methylbut-2-en-1-yl diphosphate synthase IspG/GcpE